MTSKKIENLLVKVYSGCSSEYTDKKLSIILSEVKKMESVLLKIESSIRNSGFDENSEFGKLYNELIKICK